MLKKIINPVWAFDAEWAPDPVAGRLLYKLPPETSDADAMACMWEKGGAKPEDPMPFLKTNLCRVLSIAAVSRREQQGKITLNLLSLPRDVNDPEQLKERSILEKFLGAVGKNKPMLVGYNSLGADIRIMVQRGVVLGMRQPEFCQRPAKPWEGPDYFAKGSDWNVDLKDLLTPGWSSGTPSLNEIAVCSGIPGKMEVDGQQVPVMWQQGRIAEIVAYNEFDAVTTYLLWLRMAHFSGQFTSEQYAQEQAEVRNLLEQEAEKGKPHLQDYLKEWTRLAAAVGSSL